MTKLVRRPTLLALCVAPNLLEAALLAWFGTQVNILLAPQASAPAPFGVFHDLRWLVVYANSWTSLALEGLALLVFRSLLTAFTVRAAWPPGMARPRLPALLARATLFTVAAAALLAPWTLLLFGEAVAPVSWFFLAAVPATLIIALLIHHGAIAPGWWRQTLALRALTWLVLVFLAVSAGSVVMANVPVAAAVLVAGVAGVVNAWAWRGLVGVIATRPRAAPFRPVAPIGLATLAIVVIGGTVGGFAAAAPPHTAASRPGSTLDSTAVVISRRTAVAPKRGAAIAHSPPPATGEQPVLVAAGYGTSWNGATPPGLPGPYAERRFSYRGLGPGGLPLPYTSADTDQPLVDLEHAMAIQVSALHRATHRPVSIVADSEGALVAKAYLAASPRAPVTTLVMVSPLVRPARVSYPPAGALGWGLAGGRGLLGLSDTVQPLAPIPLSPAGPFLRSVVRQAAVLQPLLSCPLPGVHQVAVLPLADAVASPDPQVDLPTLVLPAFHGSMVGNPAADRAIRAVLAGHGLPASKGWSVVDHVIASAASTWQVPGLSVPRSRSGVSLPDRSKPSQSARCPAIRSTLANQLATRAAPATPPTGGPVGSGLDRAE
ncbi:MAG TPA: hypothetical protein VE152_02945 [Acidimicrobiales bacterium]|nr:hypothetical protein [Acidimicrobiales bacterium]